MNGTPPSGARLIRNTCISVYKNKRVGGGASYTWKGISIQAGIRREETTTEIATLSLVFGWRGAPLPRGFIYLAGLTPPRLAWRGALEKSFIAAATGKFRRGLKREPVKRAPFAATPRTPRLSATWAGYP